MCHCAGSVPQGLGRLAAVKWGGALHLLLSSLGRLSQMNSGCPAGSVPKDLGRLAAMKRGGALMLSENELNGPFPEFLLANAATADGSLRLTLQVLCTIAEIH